MAVFNPQVAPTNDPNWLGWSKSISQPQPDTSTGEALTAVGSNLSAGIGAADSLIKGFAKDTARDETRALMEQYTGNLEKADISIRLAQAAQGGGPGVPEDPNASSRQSVYDAPVDEFSGQKKNILAPNQPSQTPGQLKRLPADLEMLDSARGNNKLSETAFDGRLTALAKDLRARYPGYKDFIDDEIQKVSGRNPANAYMKSLLGDINSFVTAGKEKDKEVRKLIETGMIFGIPGMEVHMQKYLRGDYGGPDEALPKIMAVVGPAHAAKLRLESLGLMRKELEGRDADVARIAENEANIQLAQKAINAFNSMHLQAGAPTAAQIQDTVNKLATGVLKADDTQVQVLGRTLEGMKATASAEADAYFNEKGPDGRTNISILGTTKAEAIKKFHMNRFSDVSSLIWAKEFGAAQSNMMTVKHMGTDDQLRLLTQGELSTSLRMDRAVNGLGLGEESKKVLQSNLQADLLPQFGEFLKHARLTMATQPQSAGGIVDTLKSQVEKLQKLATEKNLPPIQVAKTYDGMISAIEAIADPKVDPRIKSGLAKAAFDEKNLGLLTPFGEDRPGKPGKYSVYNRLFKADMTSNIKQLDGGAHWDDFKNLSTQMFSKELFGPFLKDMSNIQEHPDVKVGWDSDKHQFIWHINSGSIQTAARDNYVAYLSTNFTKVNKALKNTVNIAIEDKTDPNTYVLNLLKDNGVNLGKLPGIPEKMMQEVLRSQMDEKAREEQINKNYGIETPSPKVRPKVDLAPPPDAGLPVINSAAARGNVIKSIGDFITRNRPDTKPGLRDSALPYDVEDAPNSGSIAQRGSLESYLRNPVPTYLKQKTPQNAPQSRSNSKKSINLSDEELISTHTTDVPPGADIRDYLRK